MKIEVCLPIELDIGNESTDKWTVLPTNWQIPLDTSRIMFDKNFVLFRDERTCNLFENKFANLFLFKFVREQEPKNMRFLSSLVLLEFNRNHFTVKNHFTEHDDLLILNLASRKPFWLKKKPLEIEIKARVTALDAKWDFNDENFAIKDSYFRQMNVKQNKIEIKHHMNLDEWSPYSDTLIGLC